jgi:hypothetical protein
MLEHKNKTYLERILVYWRNHEMESMIEKAENADKYELMSDGIVAEIEDKLFMIFTYGPEPRYYLADIHAGKIVAAISMFEGCRCVLANYEQDGWRIDAIDENGSVDGSIKLCRTGIDLKTMSKTSRKRASMKGDVPRVIASDFKEAGDHGTVHRCHRDLRQNDERA